MTFVDVAVALFTVGVIAWVINRFQPAPDNLRPILNVVLALIVVGVALWLVNTYIPMAAGIRAILNIVVFLATCVRVLQAVGLWGGLVEMWSDFRTRRIPH